MKKIIIILSIVLGILAMLAGVYFAWKKSKEILTPPAPNQQTEGGQITQKENQSLPVQKLKIISDQPVFNYFISRNLNNNGTSTSAEIFYFSQEGKIFKIGENDGPEAISSETIENLQAVKSSPDGKRALVKFGSLTSPKFIIFNAEEKVFELLPENIEAAAFSPDSKKIAYLEKITGNLVVRGLEGVQLKSVKILSLAQEDFELEWILEGEIFLVPKPSAFYLAPSWSIDINKKTVSLLGEEAASLMIKWSVDGKMGLKFSNQRGSLTLIDENGITQGTLGFFTLPDKCFIAEKTIYCAVPETLPLNAVLPDDYLKRNVYFNDSFYQIDVVQNSLLEILGKTGISLDAVNLNFADNKLFFINRYDNNLYSLDLMQ
jgi:hypothetical protein